LAAATVIAGALTSVALFFYLPLISRFFKAYGRWAESGLPALPPRQLTSALDWLLYPMDVFDSKAGWRIYVGFWLALVLLLIMPVVLAGLAFGLGVHLVR
jgi:hypothetical protein